ncbi:PAS domain S-box protein [Alcanivorax sp. JB21]|uniref:PAS domain S-box protein n=1 Tax=Alcanivorax limicola TaxID=2874102 RepID=UPI001CBD2344|nr:PAS domain S-box protein [Alcanivorax limicola]MBZ2188755.1 PAS domain S-box protein [Alcanivorax limicola]
MKLPAMPADEALRQAALERLDILDTPAEARFDRLTRIAREVCDVPIALVTLLDGSRQWFKSCQGLDVTESDRRISFCGHAILDNRMLEVPDALEDERFRDNPLVTGEPFVRAYAGVPLRTVDGYAVGTLCVLDTRPRQLTDPQRRALEDLAVIVAQEINREYEKDRLRLNATIEGTHIGTWEWHLRTGETLLNERWANIVGYSLAELAPISIDTWRQLSHPGDFQASGAILRQHLRGETDFYDSVTRMKHKDGHWVWVRTRGKVMSHSRDGKAKMMFGTLSDISEQKNAEQALKTSEERLRALFEMSPIGIALSDFYSGKFVEVNQSLVISSGYTESQLLQLSNTDITPPEYQEIDAFYLRQMIETGRYGPYEKEIIGLKGQRYPVMLSGVLLTDSGGRKLVWSIVNDIGERKLMEKLKDEFIATVSHELRTPLTSISGALGLLAGGAMGELPEGIRKMVDVASKNSERLARLVNDLLDMEKLLAGKMTLQMEVAGVRGLIDEAVRSITPFSQQHDVSLTVRCEDVGAIRVDEHRFHQVMTNLLSNAVKFSPPKGDVVIQAVTHPAEGKPSSVRISVIDEGEGVPEAFRDRIFEKFSQADSSDSRYKAGTGLGLAISRELVQRMGGHIDFVSTPGKGATFYVDFPLHDGSSNDGSGLQE